jgi:hypothetical protein
MLKRYITLLIAVAGCTPLHAQNKPCSSPVYRQFDFWVGEWEAFGPKGKKAGDSKISAILDSCIILEEWTSTSSVNGLKYQGKSFNTYNAVTGQWQQTWVDNAAGSTEYLKGRFDNGKIIFETSPFKLSADTMAIRKLTFFNLAKNKVRQLGEISKNSGSTWQTEYDLEYRRKINQ